MNDIAGIPYVEAEFDKEGTLLSPQVNLPAGTTDLFVISHGWNNSASEARTLYRKFFESFVAVAQPGDLPAAKPVIVGVVWPSKKFDEMVAVAEAPDAAHGGAGIGGTDRASQDAVIARLEALKDFFTEPAQKRALEEAKKLVPELEDKASARSAFVDKIRSILDDGAANKEDASLTFFRGDGNELMKQLKVDPDDLDEEVGSTGGGAALPAGARSPAGSPGGAAGLRDALSGFAAAAMNVLNYTTYYEMKARAGTVGKNGVATLIDALAPHVQRIHLIGHSFGGRVVTATAANSSTDKIRTMTLLQAAFSHNGFSQSMPGFFRSVVQDRRIKGPILVTHTKNDKAVGLAYPLASRLNGDKTAKFGDENDVFGGIGRNGTQRMEPGEASFGRLLPVGSDYAFQAGKFLNLEASDFIKDHGDVAGREIAGALRKAVVA